MIDVVHHKTLLAAFGLHLLITSGLLVFAACLVWSRPPSFVPIVLNMLHMKHVLDRPIIRFIMTARVQP